MPVKAAKEEDVSTKLIGRWEQVCQKLEALADQIPGPKFDYRPTEDVRSIGELLRHVAFWNQYVADRVRGRKADDTANELPKEKFVTKAQIISALKQTATAVTKALKEQSEVTPELGEMLVMFIEHNCEHYGQLAIYARLNGIVPPASRG